MADKDEVEPTNESDATEPSSFDASSDDAIDDATHDGDEGLADDDPDGPEPVDAAAVEDDDAETYVEGDLTDEEFEAIVRDAELDDPTDGNGDEDGSDDDGKVLAGVGAGAAGAAAARRTTRKPKDAPTSRRDQVEKPERTTPVKFVRQSVGELRKVVYPTGQQLINYFVVVLVFVLFIIGYVSLLDLGLGQAIFAIFS